MLKNVFAFVMILISWSVSAQDIPKPEFIDVPYVWIKGSSELIKLSKETPDTKMGIKPSYKFPGTSSATHIDGSKEYSFVINGNMSGNPLATSIKLYKLDVSKKNRQMVIVTMGIAKANTNTEGLIEVNMRKAADDVYELVLPGKLEKGEYAFTNMISYFTFSID